MEFFAYIGCFDEEKLIGTRFSVSLSFDCEIGDAAETDDLSKTVNYQAVYAAVKEEMTMRVNLLETMAERIRRRIARDFTQAENLAVSISKLNPMLAAGGKIEAVTVETVC